MISFIGCLSSCLKIFKITVDEPNYHRLTRLLCLLSPLEFLELCSPYRLGDELFTVLCASAQSPLFLPQLQSLEFVCEFYSPWKSLHQILALSHWPSLRVKINTQICLFLRHIKDESAELLLELVDKGFDLRIAVNGKNLLPSEIQRGNRFREAGCRITPLYILYIKF